MKIKNNINKIIRDKRSKIVFNWDSNDRKVKSIKSHSMGTSKSYLNNNDQIIKSINNLDYNFIKPDLEIDENEISPMFNINEFYIDCNKQLGCLNQDIINEIYKIIEKLGKVLQLNIIFTFEKEYQEKFFLNVEKAIQNVNESINITISTTINCLNNICIFQKEKTIVFNNELDIINEMFDIVNGMISPYIPFSNRKWEEVSSTEMDIILPSGTGGIFIHEAIGHCLEADTFFQENSILYGKLHKRITVNNNINITDSCRVSDYINNIYSSDGTKCSDVQMIKNGYIEGVLSDSLTSKVYNTIDTGNGRNGDYNDFSIPRMRNTYLHNGKETKEDIIKNAKDGLLAIDIGGGNINPETGDFIFQITRGLRIKNGEFTNITEPYLFRGNVIKALDSINGIGNDLAFVEATCGKKGQLLKVSYGSPTIRILNRKSYY